MFQPPEKFEMKDCASHCDLVQCHLEILADHLREAYQVVSENNRNGRERQKDYNHGTKLVTFQSRGTVYLREVAQQTEMPEVQNREMPIQGDVAFVRPKLLDEIVEDKRNCC